MLLGLLRIERLHRRLLVTRCHANDETIDWLFWYYLSRLHSALYYVSPMQF
jgi:transposase InsO family protein